MTYSQANLMEVMMADRTRQVTGLWWGAQALAAAFVREARA